MRHFLDIHETSSRDLRAILELAKKVKKKQKKGKKHPRLKDKCLAMIFEKPSTRTRFSFEVGIEQLGGHAVILQSDQSQLGRGETVADTASVLSRYADLAMIRCFKHQSAIELSQNATIPVINGLTDESHPCQIMADILTYEEHRGLINGKTVAWIGDGNNVCHSWIHAAEKFGFSLRIATPEKYKVSWARRCV